MIKVSRRKRSIIWKTSIEDFKAIVESSFMIKEVLTKLGLKPSSGHYITFNQRIKKEGIDISHFNPIVNRKRSMEKIPLEDILVEKSTYQRGRLKARLINKGILKEICKICGIGNTWNGKPLSLHLDHINGINDDNRIENLRILCPNCHSQTGTFSGKNQARKDKPICKNCKGKVNPKSKSGLCMKCYRVSTRKIERPPKDTLLFQIEELGYVGTSKLYGVSDNTIRNWLKNY